MTAVDDLRVRAARGTIVNTAFTIGLQALTLLKGFVVAAFLATSEYGLWGILVIALGTLTWLKQVGISEKFVQQQAADEQLAFQRAFTLDLLANLALLALALVALPLFAVAYGEWDIIAPGLVLLLALPIYSLRAPTWVFYRHLRYGRQRLLDAADPVVAFVVTLALAVAGAGYWSLVIGFVAGAAAAALVAVLASPYPLALRYDRATTREYIGFSWPIFVANASVLVIPQASMLAGEAKLGLAGAGVITLASAISIYTDKVDQIVTWTLYPAICRVQDRTELLFEAFVKSNRLTLMWGVPFGAGVALFAGDIVDVLGPEWAAAEGLIRAFAIAAAFNHVGFNWHAFYRARGDTRPLAVSAPIVLAGFLVFALPALIVWGLEGYGYGIGAMTAVSLVVRTVYLRRLFPGFRILRQAARGFAPVLPAVAAVLLLHLAPAAELALFLALTALCTVVAERALLREVWGYITNSRARSEP